MNKNKEIKMKNKKKSERKRVAKAAALALALAFAGCSSSVDVWIDGHIAVKHEIGDVGKWELVSSERNDRGDLCTITIVCRRRMEAR